MFEYIFFDYDGTIMDTNEIIIFSLNAVAKRYLGRELTDAELGDNLGLYLDKQMQRVLPDKWEEAVKYYRKTYESLQEEMVKPFDGAFELLEKLFKQGKNLGVISAKSRDTLMYALNNFDINKYFKCVVSSQDIVNNKPHPEPALKAIEFFKADKNLCVMVGDSPYDILCAKNAGIASCLVKWTIFPDRKFDGVIPDYIARTPDEIFDICNRA